MVTQNYRMGIAEATLRRGLVVGGDHVHLTLDPLFQGLPDTAHGGAVLAAFHAMAGGRGWQALRGHYARRVPLDVPLQVALERADGASARTEGASARLVDLSGTLLVDGRVTAADAAAAAAPAMASRDLQTLPVSSACVACGIDNPIGLRARLAHDDAVVSSTWTPREALATDDGRLAPIALTVLLDEAAFWLGALASGESGMTTELEIALDTDIAFGGAITVIGRRDRVQPRAEDPRYWDTEIEAWDDAGRPVARARITFVAVRGAARRLVTGMLRMNPPDVVARAFPAYAR
jgi:hypothetical protein